MVQSSVLEGGLPDLSILGHWRREGFDPYAIVKRPHVCRSNFADNASIQVHPQRNSRALKRMIFLELAENAGGLNRSVQHWLGVYSPGLWETWLFLAPEIRTCRKPDFSGDSDAGVEASIDFFVG
jgi:hypothetical protein